MLEKEFHSERDHNGYILFRPAPGVKICANGRLSAVEAQHLGSAEPTHNATFFGSFLPIPVAVGYIAVGAEGFSERHQSAGANRSC